MFVKQQGIGCDLSVKSIFKTYVDERTTEVCQAEVDGYDVTRR